VLIVDNTITNEIMDLCEEFKSEFNRIGTPLVYLRRTAQKSISHSRNAGAKAAQGEILVFVDSDTMPFPNYLEKILSVFDKNPSAMGVGIWLLPNKKVM
jgi:cellulose synthase/poly-beta-1,6-N-acetylglucosamine synthase-like glycosyltransferase